MTIYMVSTATACEADQYGWPNFGDRSFIGWYSNYDDAYETIVENICDIWEGIYTYAFIEPWDEGTYGLHPNDDIDWFKWDNTLECYVSIPKPAPVEHFCGLTNLNQRRIKDLQLFKQCSFNIYDNRYDELVPLYEEERDTAQVLDDLLDLHIAWATIKKDIYGHPYIAIFVDPTEDPYPWSPKDPTEDYGKKRIN